MTRIGTSARKLLTIGLSALCALLLLSGTARLLGSQLVAPVGADPIKVGLVTGGPTVDDQGFNASAHQGLIRAQTELGVVGTVYPSPSAGDYAPNLQKCVDDGNAVCISVGFTMAGATLSKATANSATQFAIVDYTWSTYPGNLRGITFASGEAGYLAGILAARMTQSDVIGTIGGMRIEPVDAFIRGYRNGARCTDPGLKVLTSYTNSFDDPDLGAQAAQAMLSQGADVIFPAAGPAGNGALLVATRAGVWGIGVDTDQYINVFGNGTVTGSNKLLSSAMKRVDNAVYDTIVDVVTGAFTPGTALYDLAAQGVGLAPYHETDPFVSQAVRNEIESARLGIISGAIDIDRPCGKAVGLVTDEAGLADGAFNWLSQQGLLRAETQMGVTGKVYAPASSDDYEPKLLECVDDGNALCISVGYRMIGATESVAAANPGTYFATVDVAYDSYGANLRGITFASDEVGYLAGTLAGLMTQSDVVGTIGGMPIPPVDLFLSGYRNGARCANPGLKVLTSYTNSFDDPDLGAQAAQAMMAQGADVIFPAAGPAGNGALLAATQAGVWGIGVDTDQYVTLFGNGAVSGSNKLLSSAMKRVDNAVFDTIADAISGTFTSGAALYDLAADGVGLAPFHGAAPSVPQSVHDELERVRLGIIAGAIDVTAPCPTRIFLPFISASR